MSETVKKKTNGKISLLSIYPPLQTIICAFIGTILTIIIGVVTGLSVTFPVLLILLIIPISIIGIIYGVFYIKGVKNSIKLRKDLWFVHLLFNTIPGVPFVTAVHNRYFNKKTKYYLGSKKKAP